MKKTIEEITFSSRFHDEVVRNRSIVTAYLPVESVQFILKQSSDCVVGNGGRKSDRFSRFDVKLRNLMKIVDDMVTEVVLTGSVLAKGRIWQSECNFVLTRRSVNAVGPREALVNFRENGYRDVVLLLLLLYYIF